MTSLDHLNHTIPGIKCPEPRGPLPSYEEMTSAAIPQGIDVVWSEGGNKGANWMKVCCAPHEVHWINDCIVWCEIPPSRITLLNGTQEGELANSMAFGKCLDSNGRWREDVNEIRYVYGRSANTNNANASRGRPISSWRWVNCLGLGLAFAARRCRPGLGSARGWMEGRAWLGRRSLFPKIVNGVQDRVRRTLDAPASPSCMLILRVWFTVTMGQNSQWLMAAG
ncbi:hypothetical protein VTJ49DRAFT_5130 [Mycothermus thermophilus]|uniref:Uncharacterized protein n=1 Tax=Humicola insolens TaxID=85995 RepID=A0ABR3V4A6_HUMIN